MNNQVTTAKGQKGGGCRKVPLRTRVLQNGRLARTDLL